MEYNSSGLFVEESDSASTGGSDLGRHLADHLSDCGDEVISTDISDGGPDLLDQDALSELLLALRPDVVYHLAERRRWAS